MNGAFSATDGGVRLGRSRPDCGGDRDGDALAVGSRENRGGSRALGSGVTGCDLVGLTDRAQRLDLTSAWSSLTKWALTEGTQINNFKKKIPMFYVIL